MSLLKDLLSISSTVQEQAVDKSGVELALAHKYMHQAIKKGYPKQAAINYTANLVKGQGFSLPYAKQVAELAYKDVAEEPISEINESVNPHDLADQLEDILEELTDSVQNVKRLMRQAPVQIRNHAESYWIPALVTALGSDHDYMGGTSKYDTLAATIQKLRDEGDDE